MDAKNETNALGEKHVHDGSYVDPEVGENVLHRDLKSRHMQMIAM